MEIFIDSSDIGEIEKWLKSRLIDGVTTNPSIMLKDGHRDAESGAKKIAALVYPRPVSVEVLTNDLGEMREQARHFSRWADNIVIKIPILNEDGVPCLEVVYDLEEKGIRVNCTACMSFNQAMLAAKAGASYISLFAGRIADEGNDFVPIVQMTRDWLDLWSYSSKIIVGSIRHVFQIQESAVAGAHVITVPPDLLTRMVDHKYTRATVRDFIRDGQKAFGVTSPSSLERRAG